MGGFFNSLFGGGSYYGGSQNNPAFREAMRRGEYPISGQWNNPAYDRAWAADSRQQWVRGYGDYSNPGALFGGPASGLISNLFSGLGRAFNPPRGRYYPEDRYNDQYQPAPEGRYRPQPPANYSDYQQPQQGDLASFLSRLPQNGVENIQRDLVKVGYSKLSIDGESGPQTVGALTDYAKKHNLNPRNFDNVLNTLMSQTDAMAKTNVITNNSSPSAPAASDNASILQRLTTLPKAQALALQNDLNNIGFGANRGYSPIDGEIGPLTTRAVMDFAAARNLDPQDLPRVLGEINNQARAGITGGLDVPVAPVQLAQLQKTSREL
jgi:peptidoglycan hydrolase-like protein with peptidoglycan-binding domain